MTLDEKARQLLDVAADAAISKLRINPVAIAVGERLVYSDAFLIVSASSHRQLKAVADEIVDRALEAGFKRPRIEGSEDAQWILMDFGDVVVHALTDEQREYYALERLWADCPRIDLAVEVAQ